MRSWVRGFSAATSLIALGCSAGGSNPSNDPVFGAGGAGPGAGGASGPVEGAGGAFDPSLNLPPSAGGASSGGAGSGGAATPPPPPPEITPVHIDECGPQNGAGLDAAATQVLMAGSGGPGNLRWLNPYDGTVLPRGLIAPLLMWDGGAADVVYLHIQSSVFEYKGCLKPTGPNQLQVPEAIWKQASDMTRGATDPFLLEVTVSSGGVATGPASEKIVIAQATLKGSIFYNTYESKLAAGLLGGGAVLRISPGKMAEVVVGQGGCTGCHSVSANGTRLATFNFITGGGTYTVPPGAAAPAVLSPTAPETNFVALSPDGSIYVTNAHQGLVGARTGPTNFGAPNAGVYDSATGAAIPNSGVPTTAMTPSFSPDGTLLVFNDYAIDTGHGLALVDFDQAARTASGYRQIHRSGNAQYPAWPFLLPDNGAVVFALGALADFSGGAAGLGAGGPTALAPASDLYLLDLASGKPRLLAQAMGYATEQAADAHTPYLPFGEAEEAHHNYYPTVSPVAAGGYFWVFFDSYRHYGNRGLERALWGTAIDVSADGSHTADPSHPPFYLTGQEDGTANHRAFTALDPCKKDGEACTTGIDCCGGFCTDGVCGVPERPPPPPGDPPPPPPCARTDERCAGGTTCCNTNDRCINGYCGQIVR